MNEKQSSSSWDDLIKKIGAAPAPDALERKRPAIETTFEPPRQVDASAVKPKPGDWNALAGELGIEVPEPAAPPQRGAAGGPSSKALEASLAEIEPMESMFEEIIEEEVSEIEFEPDDDSDLEGDGSDVADEPAGGFSDSETLSGEAARNAFESLFQAGSFSALPPRKKPPVRREPRDAPVGPKWRDPEDDRPQDSDERSEFDEPAPSETDDAEGEEESATDERGRPRRRRRRRRGRGGKEGAPPSGEPAARRPSSGAEDDADQWSAAPVGEEGEEEGDRAEDSTVEGEEGDKPTRRRRVRRRRRRSGPSEPGEAAPARAASNGRSRASEADEEEDEEKEDEEEDDVTASDEAGLDDHDDDDDGEDSPRESHKNIPTWAEAISVMVETNMQSRKNSPSRPSTSRERGRGRGRGRGGSGGGGGGSGRRGKP